MFWHSTRRTRNESLGSCDGACNQDCPMVFAALAAEGVALCQNTPGYPSAGESRSAVRSLRQNPHQKTRLKYKFFQIFFLTTFVRFCAVLCIFVPNFGRRIAELRAAKCDLNLTTRDVMLYSLIVENNRR